jgi:hypothetical protein
MQFKEVHILQKVVKQDSLKHTQRIGIEKCVQIKITRNRRLRDKDLFKILIIFIVIWVIKTLKNNNMIIITIIICKRN